MTLIEVRCGDGDEPACRDDNDDASFLSLSIRIVGASIGAALASRLYVRLDVRAFMDVGQFVLAYERLGQAAARYGRARGRVPTQKTPSLSLTPAGAHAVRADEHGGTIIAKAEHRRPTPSQAIRAAVPRVDG